MQWLCDEMHQEEMYFNIFISTKLLEMDVKDSFCSFFVPWGSEVLVLMMVSPFIPQNKNCAADMYCPK